ncbi:hypothetical protein BH10BAC2_BH10BAC2_05370 [soil metagenome]
MENVPDVQKQLMDINKDALLQAIVESSDDIIISKTLEGIITTWNPAAERVFKYTAAEAIGQHISLIIPQEHLEEEKYIIGQVKLGKKVDYFETIRISKTGKRIPVSLSVSPVKDSNGIVIGASKIARDISKRQHAEERQAMLAAIISTSDDAIISKTLKGIITSWNVSAEKMFGYKEAEVLGRHISVIIPAERLKEEEYIISQIVSGNKVDHFETERLRKNGSLVPISLTVSPIKNESGTIIGASKIARDISLQKEIEETKKRYTGSLEAINSLSKAILEELNPEKVLQAVIDATTQLTGAGFGAFFYNTLSESGESYMVYTISGASKSDFENFGMPSNTAVFNPTFKGEKIVRSDDITKDPRYGHNHPHYGMPEGHLPVVSYLAVPVVAKSGVVIGGLFFGHPQAGMFTYEHEDIVASIASLAAIGLENASLYEQVKILNEKKDEFIGLASHELKTPLTSIMGYLQILKSLATDDHLKRFADKSFVQSKKLSGLIADLLDVSKIEAGKLQFSKVKLDIRTLVNDAIELIQHLNSNYQIELVTSVAGLDIEADPQRIEQVLTNLLTNAVKYSSASSKIMVFLRNDKDSIRIGVQDAGIGIPKEKLNLVFDRFYRVDDADSSISGLGIGLFISREIVKRHNGEIWVESEPGKGSTFWVTLPINSK